MILIFDILLSLESESLALNVENIELGLEILLLIPGAAARASIVGIRTMLDEALVLVRQDARQSPSS